MTPDEELAVLKAEIQDDIEHFDGVLPERFRIAWQAYVVALREWDIISTSMYEELIIMMRAPSDDGSANIHGQHDRSASKQGGDRTSGEISSELRARIQNDVDRFEGALPERVAIAWRAYLAALLVYDVISLAIHHELIALVPDVPDDPVVTIMIGREDWAPRIQNDINRFGGQLSERHAIAWCGYLSALWEWGELNERKYHELLAMVPARDDPSGDIVREQDHERWRQEGRRITSADIQPELSARLQHDIDRFDGELPERFAIAWQAYLLALLSARMIDHEAYDELIERVPDVPGDPVTELFARRED